MDIIHKAKINKRTLVFKESDNLKNFLYKFEDGQELEVIIRKPRKDKSSAQIRYYFAILTDFCKETGETDKESIHTYFKSRFLLDRTGKFPRVKSINTLTTIEMMEYIDRVIQVLAEFGYIAPQKDQINY